MDNSITLTPSLLSSFSIGKVFSDFGQPINSCDFYKDGSLAVVASDNDTLKLYSVRDPKVRQTIKCLSYGIENVTFTHHESAVLCSSKAEIDDDCLRYLSLHDNQYLRFFKGHQGRITSISLSPVSDIFISTGVDNTLRVWDLRSSKSEAVLRPQLPSTIAQSTFDPQGVIFAVCSLPNVVKLYGTQHYQNGPFMTFKAIFQSHQGPYSFSGIAISPDGKLIAISTSDGMLAVFDAFEGVLVCDFSPFLVTQSGQSVTCQPSWTPDSKFILYSNANNQAVILSMDSRDLVATWSPQHAEPITAAKFNPKSCMAMTADSTVLFWIPQLKKSSFTR